MLVLTKKVNGYYQYLLIAGWWYLSYQPDPEMYCSYYG